MKSSVFIVLVVLVASTYAGYLGPYRHHYVPGFQHTYVLHISAGLYDHWSSGRSIQFRCTEKNCF